MNILTVPIRVDAFVATGSEPVVTTIDDFDNLPYVNKQQLDINFDVANIASSIARKPLNGYQAIPAGVHLHWSMPDALTQGVVSEGEDEGISMPIVPNRWLVKRIPQQGNGEVKSWVVESDYLYPDGVIPDRAIAIPAMTNKAAGSPNWQYLGRQLPLEQWLAETEAVKQTHQYLPELNVLGWGTPYFSALYSDCYSVFGFYDAELNDEQVQQYHYEVYGWYSETEKDYVQRELTQTGDTQQALATEKASWQFSLTEGELLTGMVCYGKVMFAQEMTLTDPLSMTNDYVDGTQIAFAKSPVEALATYLAKKYTAQHGGDTSAAIKLENQLLALLYNEDTAGQDIDFVDSLKNARHQAEFDAISGGELWVMLDDASLLENIDSSDLKAAIKALWSCFERRQRRALHQLNKVQEAKNQAEDNVSYQQRMLYNDWSKYMLSLHPVDLEGDYYPDVDLLRLLMTQKSIPALEASLERLRALTEQINKRQTAIEKSYQLWLGGLPESLLADVLAEGGFDGEVLAATDQGAQIAWIGEKLVQKLPDDILQEVPAPRYWQAKEPCLLIEGDAVKASVRHGADGELACQVNQTNIASVQAWLLALPHNEARWQWQESAINQWQQQPWSPLMVEWSMNLYPDKEANQAIEANQTTYNKDFITSNYRIPLNDEEFSLPSVAIDLHYDAGNRLTLSDQPNVINGRSLLTDSIKNVLAARISHYLATAEEEADSLSDTEQALVNTIQAVSDLLAQTDCTIFSFDGLHDELLMYSNLSLMDVDDPFAFSPRHGDEQITTKVKRLLQGQDFKLPALGHRFTPIKSGINKLGVIQLVDSFGRYKRVNCDNVLRPQRELIGNALYAAPRVLQPLRLSFRWVDNSAARYPTPILGWLGYNLFDESVLLFNETGALLGQINSDGEWCNERGMLQSLGDDISRQLRIFILKILSFHHANRISKEAFLAQKKASEALWNSFIENGVLQELSAEKAQVIPIGSDDWQQNMQPLVGIDFSEARALLLASGGSNNYWPSLKKAIRRAIDNIEPLESEDSANSTKQQSNITPLAIVQAQLDLQLKGGAESDKSWSALNLDLNNPIGNQFRSNRGYMSVEFPIKLGEFNNLDDGLVGYWQMSNGGQLDTDGFFPQSDMDDVAGYIDAANFNPDEHDYIDQIRAESVQNLSHSLADNPINLLMLMAPDAAVHATTGIVPKKSLFLTVRSYEGVLERIGGRYFVAPLLTPMQETVIPLTTGSIWQWETPTGNKTAANKPIYQQEFTLEKVHQEAFLAAGGTTDDWQWLIAKRLLTSLDEAKTNALITSTNQTLDIESQARWLTLQSLLDSVAAQSLTSGTDITPLNQKVRVMEGWLTCIDEEE